MGKLKTITSGMVARTIWPVLRKGGEKTTWRQRWEKQDIHNAVDLWLHTASYGEIVPYRELLVQMQAAGTRIGITVTSGRSFEAVADLYGDVAQVCHLPIPDSPGFEHLVQTWQASHLVLLEAEAWPALLALVPDSVSSVGVLGGRMTKAGSSSWRKLFRRADPSNIKGILVATDEKAQSYLQKGAPAGKVISGFHAKLIATRSSCDARFAELKNQSGPTIVAGSIHVDEAHMLADAWQRLSATDADASLVIAPRHPERSDDIVNAFQARDLTAAVWPASAPVTVVGEFGVLAGLYELADLALVGGAWNTKGGHNPIEALLHGIPVILGPHCHNQADLLALTGNAITISDIADLPEQIVSAIRERPESADIEQAIRRSRDLARKALEP